MAAVLCRKTLELIYVLTQHRVLEERNPSHRLLLPHHVDWCHVVLSRHQENSWK